MTNTIKPIEVFAHGKTSDNSYSEDIHIVTPTVAAVIDGSIGPDYRETDIIQACIKQAAEIIGNIGASDKPTTLYRTLAERVRAIKSEHGVTECRYTGGFHSVIYSAHHHQIWRVGDCVYRHGGKTYANDLEVEAISSRQRAVMIHAMILRGMSTQEIMESDDYAQCFMPFFKPLLDFANRDDHPYGYGVISGLPVPDAFIKVHSLPKTTNELILASDGFPIVCDSLSETQATLEKILDRDPLCINENITSKGMMPGQVSYDDRTYLKFSIE